MATHRHGPMTDLEILLSVIAAVIVKRCSATGHDSAAKWERDGIEDQLVAKLIRLGRLERGEVLNEAGKRHFTSLLAYAKRKNLLKVGRGKHGNRPLRLTRQGRIFLGLD